MEDMYQDNHVQATIYFDEGFAVPAALQMLPEVISTRMSKHFENQQDKEMWLRNIISKAATKLPDMKAFDGEYFRVPIFELHWSFLLATNIYSELDIPIPQQHFIIEFKKKYSKNYSRCIGWAVNSID